MSDAIMVIGGGSWGTAFTSLLARAGSEATLLVRDPEQAATMQATRHNPRYLPDLELSPAIEVSALGDGERIADAGLLVIAVPSRGAREVAARVARHARAPIRVLSLAKGLDPSSGRRLSEIWGDALGERDRRLGVGPSLDMVELLHAHRDPAERSLDVGRPRGIPRGLAVLEAHRIQLALVDRCECGVELLEWRALARTECLDEPDGVALPRVVGHGVRR